ncbi:molybdenum cofactor guanylyltransferase [Marinomonas epiphytica]
MSSENASFSLTGGILAGGLATRMGGANKGLMLHRGKPMVQWIYQTMLDSTTTVLVNANQYQDEYDALGFITIQDQDHLNKGPLSGILRALQASQTSHLLVCPCDTPNITKQAFAALINAARQQPSTIHYLTSLQRAQPLHAILPVGSTLPALIDWLAQDNLAVMGFYKCCGAVPVCWERESDFYNINHEHELA